MTRRPPSATCGRTTRRSRSCPADGGSGPTATTSGLVRDGRRPGSTTAAGFLIDSGLPWDEHGYRAYDGYGWYRQSLRAPALPAGKRIYLAFGAVAHGAEVYVNGHLAGQHNMDGWAHAVGDPWRKRFLIDVTELLAEGRDNAIAVRVVDYGPWGGGIWKPVKLVAEK